MMSYERSCRLCLTDLTEAPVDCSTIPELYETVKVLFDVEVCRTDNIRGICNRCLDYVMGYRALKKKITECQKIIQDYEEVRKKVMETRNNALSMTIKQEVIDVETLCDSRKSAIPNVTSNHTRRPPKAVTDSDINDILALVHDKSKNSKSKRASTKNRKLNTQLVKSERETPLRPENENRSPSLEPISSTSRDLEKPVEGRKRATYAQKSYRRKNGAKAKAREKSTNVKSPALDATADCVSSSVQTPSDCNNVRQSGRVSTRKRKLSPAKASSKGKEKKETNRKTNSKVSRCNLICSLCRLRVTTSGEMKAHMLEKHNSDTAVLDSSKKPEITSPKDQVIKVEDDSISSTGSKDNSIRRSARQAKSQALKKISPKPKNSIASGRQSRAGKLLETPNNSMVEPQQTSTPVVLPLSSAATASLPPPVIPKEEDVDKNVFVPNQTIKSENLSASLSNSTFFKDNSLNKSDKKRIITITLVRTKESLNFRYCDQYKRNIDFHTVSPDELEDIRKSLMIPEIWANLREAFKNSPPDGKTIDQLKTILGDEFVL